MNRGKSRTTHQETPQCIGVPFASGNRARPQEPKSYLSMKTGQMMLTTSRYHFPEFCFGHVLSTQESTGFKYSMQNLTKGGLHTVKVLSDSVVLTVVLARLSRHQLSAVLVSEHMTQSTRKSTRIPRWHQDSPLTVVHKIRN